MKNNIENQKPELLSSMALLPKVWPTDDIISELGKSAEIQAPPHTYGIRMGMLTRSAVIQIHINI